MRYFDLLKKVYEEGQDVCARNLNTKELTFQTLTVDDYNSIAVREHRDWKEVSTYLYAELAWYLSGKRTLEDIRPYSKFWDKIKNIDETINSQYGHLVYHQKNKYDISSFGWALRNLREDKETRKAIILYNDRELFYESNKDLICNQYQQFLIRNDELIGCVALRSSDMIYGLTFNIPWWSMVHQDMFLMLKPAYPNLKLGSLTAFLGSVHIYENKFELVEKMLSGEQEYRFLKLKKALPLHAYKSTPVEQIKAELKTNLIEEYHVPTPV